MKKIVILILFLISPFLLLKESKALTLDFNDILGPGEYANFIPPGYGGFNYDNAFALAYYPESPLALPSPGIAALGPGPIVISRPGDPFILRSLTLLSGVQIPGMEFVINGFLDDAPVFSETGIVAGILGDYILQNILEIDEVHLYATNSQYYIILDDIEVDETQAPVPEPSTRIFLSLGCLGITGLYRKKYSV